MPPRAGGPKPSPWQRNGHRDRDWDTRVGTVELAIPRLRTDSESILDARRRAEKTLRGVLAQCYVEGMSTRRVDDIAKAVGIEVISTSKGGPRLGSGPGDQREARVSGPVDAHRSLPRPAH